MANLATYVRPVLPTAPSTVPDVSPTAKVGQFQNQQLGGLLSGQQVANQGITPVATPSVTPASTPVSPIGQQLQRTQNNLKTSADGSRQQMYSLLAQRRAQAQQGAGVGLSARGGNPGGEFANDSALDNADFAAGKAPKGVVRYQGGYLQANAARNLQALNSAYHAATGQNLTLTEGWRSMSTQQQLYALYRAGKGVAVSAPGGSIHTSGNAADLGGISSSGFNWLVRNASKYGWQWAGNGISGRREPWLWKFVG